MEIIMRKLAFFLLAVSLLSVAVSAQQDARDHCPAGYDLVGKVCQASSTGDVVLPN
jgi:hypothetical protein